MHVHVHVHAEPGKSSLQDKVDPKPIASVCFAA